MTYNVFSGTINPTQPVVEKLRLRRIIRVYRPTKHIIGHVGDMFYGSNDPTNSVKALKKASPGRLQR